jgi:hypothetical protein
MERERLGGKGAERASERERERATRLPPPCLPLAQPRKPTAFTCAFGKSHSRIIIVIGVNGGVNGGVSDGEQLLTRVESSRVGARD